MDAVARRRDFDMGRGIRPRYTDGFSSVSYFNTKEGRQSCWEFYIADICYSNSA
jgi:hypothetical protein